MLVEDGFKVYSTDASDKMLKYALKERWHRRHEKNFDTWGIELLILFAYYLIQTFNDKVK